MRQSLDRYITGNYGEDQFDGEADSTTYDREDERGDRAATAAGDAPSVRYRVRRVTITPRVFLAKWRITWTDGCWPGSNDPRLQRYTWNAYVCNAANAEQAIDASRADACTSPRHPEFENETIEIHRIELLSIVDVDSIPANADVVIVERIEKG